ncbi:MAG: hypothetical protein PHU27_02945 [Salinivirgaceae bacterium]|nr:hypothetical protein [Salinivirgaceae bacterium]MDD4747281.1 hypothetical protein [Salinivirgaceae bacterium]
MKSITTILIAGTLFLTLSTSLKAQITDYKLILNNDNSPFVTTVESNKLIYIFDHNRDTLSVIIDRKQLELNDIKAEIFDKTLNQVVYESKQHDITKINERQVIINIIFSDVKKAIGNNQDYNTIYKLKTKENDQIFDVIEFRFKH